MPPSGTARPETLDSGRIVTKQVSSFAGAVRTPLDLCVLWLFAAPAPKEANAGEDDDEDEEEEEASWSRGCVCKFPAIAGAAVKVSVGMSAGASFGGAPFSSGGNTTAMRAIFKF